MHNFYWSFIRGELRSGEACTCIRHSWSCRWGMDSVRWRSPSTFQKYKKTDGLVGQDPHNEQKDSWQRKGCLRPGFWRDWRRTFDWFWVMIWMWKNYQAMRRSWASPIRWRRRMGRRSSAFRRSMAQSQTTGEKKVRHRNKHPVRFWRWKGWKDRSW